MSGSKGRYDDDYQAYGNKGNSHGESLGTVFGVSGSLSGLKGRYDDDYQEHGNKGNSHGESLRKVFGVSGSKGRYDGGNQANSIYGFGNKGKVRGQSYANAYTYYSDESDSDDYISVASSYVKPDNTKKASYQVYKNFQSNDEERGVRNSQIEEFGEGESFESQKYSRSESINLVPYPAFNNPLTYGELGRRQSFVSQNFTLTMNRVRPENPVATGGSVRRLTTQNMPALQDMSSSLKYLKPCSIVLPHYHPRGSELIHVKKKF